MKKITLLLAMASIFAANSQELQLQQFASGFSSPVEIAHAGDDRLFVVQQTGQIRIVNADGTVNPTNFLNLSSVIASGGERGLLGLAFHPDYAENGEFFVNYTRAGDGATVIARYLVSATDPNVADPSSASIIMTVDQPATNHNGGTIKFGPDGFLYIGMGDGGGGGDSQNRAQNIETNLGKMLRINIDSDAAYSNPDTNPFIGVAGNDEIWAIGMRNPWKFSFNRLNGDMWIADVGQDAVEEINHIQNPLSAGLNFGWRCYEGTVPYNTTGCPEIGTLTMPVFTYTHQSAPGSCVSITGGYEYTGISYPNLVGKYIFADYCYPRIGVLDSEYNVSYTPQLANLGFVTSFGEDYVGELYVIGNQGNLHKIIDTSLNTNDVTANTFSVYPNPAKSEINITNNSQHQLTNVTIYDVSGKKLLTKKLDNLTTNNVSVSMLSSGIYILSVENSHGAKHTTRLVIE